MLSRSRRPREIVSMCGLLRLAKRTHEEALEDVLFRVCVPSIGGERIVACYQNCIMLAGPSC